MAAGDISKTLLARVRTSLDETTEGYFLDAEIYKALTDAQRETINFVLAVYKQKIAINPEEKLPEVLRVLQGTIATGTGTQNLPTGFLYPLAVYTSALPVFIRPDGITRGASKYNTYLASSASQPYCSFSATQIVFETSVAWSLEHLVSPSTDIDTSHDPTLTASAYEAIVEYAIAFMLAKDENPRSAQHLQKFFQLIQNLIF